MFSSGIVFFIGAPCIWKMNFKIQPLKKISSTFLIYARYKRSRTERKTEVITVTTVKTDNYRTDRGNGERNQSGVWRSNDAACCAGSARPVACVMNGRQLLAVASLHICITSWPVTGAAAYLHKVMAAVCFLWWKFVSYCRLRWCGVFK